MVNIFLDTNLLLRYVIGDSREQQNIVGSIFQLNNKGRLNIAISDFVLSEFVFVLVSIYKIPRIEILDDLQKILLIKNLYKIEETNIKAAMKLYKNSNEKWSDCMIVSQVPSHYNLCSFDKRLAKLIGKKRYIHPRDIAGNFPAD